MGNPSWPAVETGAPMPKGAPALIGAGLGGRRRPSWNGRRAGTNTASRNGACGRRDGTGEAGSTGAPA